MEPAEERGRVTIAELYRGFGQYEARGVSETYETWALDVSEDHEVLTFLESIPLRIGDRTWFLPLRAGTVRRVRMRRFAPRCSTDGQKSVTPSLVTRPAHRGSAFNCVPTADPHKDACESVSLGGVAGA